jgi:hypothetical protein
MATLVACQVDPEGPGYLDVGKIVKLAIGNASTDGKLVCICGSIAHTKYRLFFTSEPLPITDRGEFALMGMVDALVFLAKMRIKFPGYESQWILAHDRVSLEAFGNMDPALAMKLAKTLPNMEEVDFDFPKEMVDNNLVEVRSLDPRFYECKNRHGDCIYLIIPLQKAIKVSTTRGYVADELVRLGWDISSIRYSQND